MRHAVAMNALSEIEGWRMSDAEDDVEYRIGEWPKALCADFARQQA